jgi:predicted amidophosphoribosyltransferase
VQCVDCNTYSLSQLGRETLPFDRCISAIEHRGAARSIVTSYKDAGERSLARQMAAIVGQALPRSWTAGPTVLTYVPADRVARRRRGFDHMAGIARELSALRGLHLLPLLEKLPVADQRGLSRRGRFANMERAVRALAPPDCAIPERVLLLDDVYTTGATLFAASEALRTAGVRRVDCATFARVP